MKQNKDNQNKKQRSGFAVMCGLIGMIKPLLGIMCLAILMGCAGNLMATFLTILGGYALLTVTGVYSGMKFSVIFTLLVCFAVARGILRYAEQASNHYIAFKLLARIRHQVFDSLRRLAPAKLDGAKKGNLISIITSDIELLEVFYAHTISPIAIAVITSVVMTIFLGRIHPVFGVLALFFYVLVGAVIPVVNGRIGAAGGKEYREAFGALNTCVLDNLYGLEETLQYGQQEARIAKMAEQTGHLETVNGALKRGENLQRVITDDVILFAGVLAALVGGTLAENGSIPGSGAVIAVIALASSFGPTAALSALSNNLNHTLASGNRVLDILEEKPLVAAQCLPPRRRPQASGVDLDGQHVLRVRTEPEPGGQLGVQVAGVVEQHVAELRGVIRHIVLAPFSFGPVRLSAGKCPSNCWSRTAPGSGALLPANCLTGGSAG